jgi:hypothetical protein
MDIAELEIRRATSADGDEIALAHRDSIRSIGPGFYPPDAVDAWEQGLTGDLYVKAMGRGEASSRSAAGKPA